MRLFTNNILLFLFIMLIGMTGYAEKSPPAPQTTDSVNQLNETEPPLPIDKSLFLLVLAGISFGTYITQYKKRSA